MMGLLLASGVALAQEPVYSGGNGSSCEEAVVVAAVEAEYHWLRKTYGGGAVVGQTFGSSHDGKRRYDLVRWRKPDGATVDVCFDVTKAFESDPGRPSR